MNGIRWIKNNSTLPIPYVNIYENNETSGIFKATFSNGRLWGEARTETS